MNKQRNKTNMPHVSVAEQPGAAPVLSPQRPKTTPKSSRQQPKSLSESEQRRSIPDRPLSDMTKSVEPIHDEVAKRAYEIYMEKGCPQDQDDQIWLEAEIELLHKKMSLLSSKLHL